MSRLLLYTFAISVLLSPSPSVAQEAEAPAARRMTAGDFLRMQMLKPRSLRRTSTFLGVKKTKPHLQVAFVIDGTESMGQEIGALKENLQLFSKGVRVHQQGEEMQIELAVVVYRDTGSPSGPVQLATPKFTDSLETLHAALDAVKTEPGDPYFNEAGDQGVYAALSRLNWAEDDQTTRWLILCGDAPPFPEGTDYRRHTTKELVDLARSKDVSVYALLTNSGFVNSAADNPALEKVARENRPDATAFMAKLSTESGGRFVDVWDREQVDRWLSGSVVVEEKIRAITPDDVAALQKELAAKAGASNTARMAVLPHRPFDRMSFDAGDGAVQVAAAIRYKFRRIPGLDVTENYEVQNAYRGLGDASSADPQALTRLADRLGVDFVIWGDYKSDFDRVRLESRMYPEKEQKPIAEAGGTADEDNSDRVRDLAFEVASQLRDQSIAALKSAGSNLRALAALASGSDDREFVRQFSAPLSRNIRAQRLILQGLDLLEQSLQYAKSSDGSPEEQRAREQLQGAADAFELALKYEPDNPFTHLLLSSCYFNLAGEDDAGDEIARHHEHLEKAWEHRDHELFRSDPVRTEIEAMYALLVTKDAPTAVARFEELTKSGQQSRGRFALRAHWMLAGIRLGDWGAQDYAPKLVDAEAARNHILHILTLWPGSSEAAFYRACIESGTADKEVTIPVGEGRLAASF